MIRPVRHLLRGLQRGRHRSSRRKGGLVVLAGTLLLSPAPVSARPRALGRVALAARFIVSQQQPDGSFPALSSDPIGWTADAVVALANARRARKAAGKALDYLEASADAIDTVGEKSKVVMARLAGDRDPRDFVGRDLIAEVESSQQADGRYGFSTSVFSHSLAMLALVGAEATRTLDAAARWLMGAQCEDGGWQFAGPPTPAEDEHCSLGYPDIDEANTDTTSLAVQALQALVTPVAPERDPFAFLETLRDHANGGWTYDRPTSLHANFTSKYANANSSGMVLQAYAAAGAPPPDGSRAALAMLQDPLCGQGAGSFSYTWGDEDGDGSYERSGTHNLAATIAAVPGLLGAELPPATAAGWRPPPRPEECAVNRSSGPK